MGLHKEIELSNGITLGYYRIVSLNVITNQQNVIEVAGYTSQEKREEEEACRKALAKGDNDASCDVYIETMYLSAPYDQSMTVETAYEWLKEQDTFSGAEDVLEK